jgi:hypothetical protein
LPIQFGDGVRQHLPVARIPSGFELVRQMASRELQALPLAFHFLLPGGGVRAAADRAPVQHFCLLLLDRLTFEAACHKAILPDADPETKPRTDSGGNHVTKGC